MISINDRNKAVLIQKNFFFFQVKSIQTGSAQPGIKPKPFLFVDHDAGRALNITQRIDDGFFGNIVPFITELFCLTIIYSQSFGAANPIFLSAPLLNAVRSLPVGRQRDEIMCC